MLRKFGLAALALVMSLGILSTSEAAQDSQANLCCRGNYCYNQSYARSADRNVDCGEYCCDGQRGCW